MKNGTLINLIKKVKCINWGSKEEIEFLLELDESSIEFIIESDESMQRYIIDFLKSKSEFINKDDFEFAIRKIFMTGFDHYLKMPTIEGKFYLEFLHNERIINTKYYRNIVEYTRGSMYQFEKYPFATIILNVFNSELVNSNKLDEIMNKLFKFSINEGYKKLGFINTVLNNGKINSNLDLLEFCVLKGLDNLDNQSLSLLFTHPVLLNRNSYKDVVSFIVNKEYLYDFINLINNRNLIKEVNGKVFYESDEFKNISDDINEVKAFALIYNSEMKSKDNELYDRFQIDIKNLNNEIKPLYAELVVRKFKSKEERDMVLINARAINDVQKFKLYVRLVNSELLNNPSLFNYIVSNVLVFKDNSKIDSVVWTIEHNSNILRKKDFITNFDKALILDSRSSDSKNFKWYMALLSNKEIDNSVHREDIMEILNYVADLIYVEPFYKLIHFSGIFEHELFMYFVNNFKRIPENHYNYVEIVKSLVKNKIDNEKTRLTIETYIKNRLMLNSETLKFFIHVVVSNTIEKQDNYVTLLESTKKMNFKMVNIYSKIFMNESVVNIDNLSSFINNILRINDEKILNEIFESIKIGERLDVLFNLKEESQFYLFNKFIMNKELSSHLRGDIKENTFNVIQDGMVNSSYKILYMILASDLSVSIKHSCLLWLKEGICTLEDLKIKLKWLSKYEEFRETVLDEFYKLESDYNNVERVSELEKLGLDLEVDKTGFMCKLSKLRINN